MEVLTLPLRYCTWSWRVISGWTPAADAALLARDHRQQRGAERGDALVDRLLRSGAQRHHRDHGGDADHDAEHGQERAQLVGAQRLEGDPNDLADLHG
jgi:hypothetical protein